MRGLFCVCRSVDAYGSGLKRKGIDPGAFLYLKSVEITLSICIDTFLLPFHPRRPVPGSSPSPDQRILAMNAILETTGHQSTIAGSSRAEVFRELSIL